MQNMENNVKNKIRVQTIVRAPVEKVWKCWTTPADITGWNNASPDWHTPHAEIDLRVGGKFSSRMEARDGSMGFDFWGIYDKVIDLRQLDSTLGDGRKLSVTFSADGDNTEILETFEAESSNSLELQRTGWQAILDNFKKYTEER
jgi:uncharacterized protein YndB with AHSA1/START domain